jgi:transposase-like protein
MNTEATNNRSTPLTVPQTEVTAAAPRRRFSPNDKQRILAELDNCSHGEAGAILRREGVYHGQIAKWRKQLSAALTPAKRGRKPREDTQIKRENLRLERENARLRRRLEATEKIIEVQKKVSELLGITLPHDE